MPRDTVIGYCRDHSPEAVRFRIGDHHDHRVPRIFSSRSAPDQPPVAGV